MEIRPVDINDPSHIAVMDNGKVIVELKGSMSFYAAGAFITIMKSQLEDKGREFDYIFIAASHIRMEK